MEQEKTLWSFSRLTSYNTCSLGFDLKYNQKLEEVDNAWGVIGTLMHDAIEGFFKGELKDPAYYFSQRYPWHMKFFARTKQYHDLYYNGIMYFLEHTIHTLKSNIVSVEDYLLTHLFDNHYLQGYNDLLTKDDGLIIIDWKISKKASFVPKISEKKKQVYLYAKGIKEKFGEFPKEMYFYLVPEGYPVHIPFDMKEYERSLDWAKETIETIVEGNKKTRPQRFFCKNICGQRKNCPELNS